MTKRPKETWEEWQKRRDVEMKKYHCDLRFRYKNAFAKNKVNWLRVDFHPITKKYCDEKAEQKYLTEYGNGLIQEWRSNRHLFQENHIDPRLKKIIEKERQLRREWGLFGIQPVKVNRVTCGHKDKPERNINRKLVKKINYRD